ncbi:ppGpp synthetase/RelA/SpoT-type nucleotidyltransferase [Chryseobacterium defluvii]|uniref:PpGpp synthetase/RelA/SpoT-type nucleotidyltransferase n=1 Tax=Chryseobacterium defluvii TaxID=160396 RepID=A0A840KAZ6_9FLAO|nr:(p)ppGpp synthetase [Chryseobacterium defluvii]MBB4804994.1 ppGpp synthetase/RelA/SpoT-type nucleotidyltransferase [Chryseobacterium defluvii]
MNDLCKEYEKNISKYSDFKDKAELLIKELLIQNKLSFHKIESRIKNVDRLDEKIQRKNNKYSNLDEITDLIGIRIITYYEDEVDHIAQMIEKEFIKDEKNSIDKRVLETDKFGYRSLHYVVELSLQRKKLTEYSRFLDLKIEIQIRSILQHAWAEIEHDIGYKGEFDIPDKFKRNFYRVAALLETADIEFINIKNGLEKYEKELKQNFINKKTGDVDINLTSLRAYAKNSEIVKSLDNEIAKSTNKKLLKSFYIISNDVQRLKFLNIRNIKELDTLLISYQNKIVAFAKHWIDKDEEGEFHRGISLFYLCYVLIGEKNELKLATDYFENYIFSGLDSEKNGKRILDTFLKISKI